MAIEELIDRLYGLPLAAFTSARNEAAGELRKAGQREAAERVKALRKPTAVAGAVNRLVREHRDEVEQFLRAAAELRDAQFSGKGDLATATKREHEELERLTHIGGEAVRQTLLAAAVDDGAAQQLLEARLEQELELRGFGTLLAHAPPAAAKPRGATTAQTNQVLPESMKSRESPAPAKPTGATAQQPKLPERKKPDDSAARAQLQHAKVALSAAETEERHAIRRWEQTQRDLEEARAAVEKSQSDVKKAQASVEEARAAVDGAQRDLDRLHDG